eukprot:6463274-Amphidinium_carterae.1
MCEAEQNCSPWEAAYSGVFCSPAAAWGGCLTLKFGFRFWLHLAVCESRSLGLPRKECLAHIAASSPLKFVGLTSTSSRGRGHGKVLKALERLLLGGGGKQ